MTRTKLLSFCGFLALIACGAQAQKVKVFGGCQYLRLDSGPNQDRNSPAVLTRSIRLFMRYSGVRLGSGDFSTTGFADGGRGPR